MKFIALMEAIRAEGCIVSLRLGPYGWSCDITDPDVTGTNVARHETPDAAVTDAHARWEEKRAAWWRKQA